MPKHDGSNTITFVPPINPYILTGRANQLRSLSLPSKRGELSRPMLIHLTYTRIRDLPLINKDERLDEIGNVHWHLLDLSAIELFNFPHHTHILRSNEVDSDAFSSKTSTTSDTMDVVLTVRWKVIVDDK